MQRVTQSRTRLRAMSGIVAAVGIVAVGLFWNWATSALRLPPTLVPGSSVDIATIPRRAEAAFLDVEAWTARAAHGARAAELIAFRGATSSACAAGVEGRGAFYCPETGVAALDLGYLEALVARLRRDADLGVALVAARLASEHRQRETGVLDTAALDMIGATQERRAEIGVALALQADCLTGAWAASATAALGPVAEKFWGELIWTARNVSADFDRAGRPIPPELDTFAIGARDERTAAFARGYEAASAGACPTPVRPAIR